MSKSSAGAATHPLQHSARKAQGLQARAIRQQIVDVRANSRWIGIPLALPVAVDLPVWTREAVIVGPTPPANGVVRGAEAAIRPEMRCRCHCASRRCRANDVAVLGKRPMKLHPHLEPNAAIPIDSDVATCLCLLRTHDVPDQATALRYDASEIGRARLASDDGERDTIESLELDGVRRHAALPLLARVRQRSPLPPVAIDRHDPATVTHSADGDGNAIAIDTNARFEQTVYCYIPFDAVVERPADARVSACRDNLSSFGGRLSSGRAPTVRGIAQDELSGRTAACI